MTGASELAHRINARKSGANWIARCPVPGHGQGRGDRSPSLSISEGDGGKVLWKCHAGCSQEDVREALGLEKTAPASRAQRPVLVDTFEYRDAAGKLLHVKKRWEPGFDGGRKSFTFEHNGEKGRGGEAVLYNAPALSDADTVLLVEGEGKGDLLTSWGLTATCLDSGAGSPFRPEYAEILAGKNIVILPDNDGPGQKYAQKIATALHGKAASIRIIDLPRLPEKGDVIDWALLAGNDKARLLELIAAAPEWTPGETPEAPLLRLVSLENLEHAELNPSKYAIAQLYPKKEVILGGGHGGSGKTLLALIHAAHKAAGVPWFGFDAEEGRVVFFSFEDGAPVIKYRLKKICQVYGLPYDLIIRNLIILDGSDLDGSLAVETSDYGVRSIAMTPLFHDVVVACKGAALVFIDNASDCYSGNEIDRRQVRAFIRELRNRIARPNNAGVVLLAHIDKAGARGGTNENTYSGSTAWHNTVRARWALTAKKDGTVELAQEKLNLGKKLDRPIPLTWVDGVLIPDSNIAEGLQAGAQDDLDKTALLAAIEAAIADGADIPTARTGPRTAQGVLEKYPDLPSHLKRRKGRDAFYKSLSNLQREGTLKSEDYWTAARNQSQRYIVNSTSCVYTPVPPCTEPTKGTKVPSLVAGVALIAGTNETHETHDKPKLWIFSLPDGTVVHTQPSDMIQEELVI